MSHIVRIQTQIRDGIAAQAACQRLGLPPPAQRTVQLFATTVSGLAVELAGWVYPLVCDLGTGTLHFDNYEGRWGDRSQLDRFLQAYAVEKARLEARRMGHAVSEQPLEGGAIKLTIHVGGAA